MEVTFVIIKPDAVLKGVVDLIRKQYEDHGLTVTGVAKMKLSMQDVHALYSEHSGKFFFEGLLLSMTSGPVWILHLEGENALEQVRKLNGATDPAKAEPGTIRHDFRSAGGPFNTVHAPDSPEAFDREYQILFGYPGY